MIINKEEALLYVKNTPHYKVTRVIQKAIKEENPLAETLKQARKDMKEQNISNGIKSGQSEKIHINRCLEVFQDIYYNKSSDPSYKVPFYVDDFLVGACRATTSVNRRKPFSTRLVLHLAAMLQQFSTKDIKEELDCSLSSAKEYMIILRTFESNVFNYINSAQSKADLTIGNESSANYGSCYTISEGLATLR